MTDMRVPMTEWMRRGGAGHFTGPDNGAPMDGLHLTADLRGCAAERSEMIDTAALRALCLAAVDRAGLRSVGELFHRFAAGGGITGVVLLAESHLAVHTWPEIESVTLDVYVCNFGADQTAKARGLMFALVNRFQPEWTEQRSLDRGDES